MICENLYYFRWGGPCW